MATMFSKRHYLAVSNVLRSRLLTIRFMPNDEVKEIAAKENKYLIRDMCDMFAEDSPNFDTTFFIKHTTREGK